MSKTRPQPKERNRRPSTIESASHTHSTLTLRSPSHSHARATCYRLCESQEVEPGSSSMRLARRTVHHPFASAILRLW
jgi:hypothetical protein